MAAGGHPLRIAIHRCRTASQGIAPVIAAVVACTAAYVATYLAVASPPALAFGLASQVLFVLPGILILRAIAPAQGWLPAIGFGPFVGQALGSLLLKLLGISSA